MQKGPHKGTSPTAGMNRYEYQMQTEKKKLQMREALKVSE